MQDQTDSRFGRTILILDRIKIKKKVKTSGDILFLLLKILRSGETLLFVDLITVKHLPTI